MSRSASNLAVTREEWQRRLDLVWRRWRLILRLVLSTTAAYAAATYLLGHNQAFFAPMAAIIALTAGGPGVRGRVAIELVVGVAVGVLIGELFILAIGRGWWQVGLVAALTTVAATLAGVKGLALTQALNAAVLLVVVVPAAATSDPAFSRFLDALIGGVFGLVVTIMVPRDTVRDIDREVDVVMVRLSGILRQIAEALRTNDAEVADVALAQARSTQGAIDRMRDTASSVNEVARLSPMRWRQRPAVEAYLGSTTHLDHAVRDVRVMARRSSAMLRNGEQAPADLAAAVDDIARATVEFKRGLPHGEAHDMSSARDSLVSASNRAIGCLTGVLTVNNAAIAAQVRSLAADLLLASGLTTAELDDRLAGP